MSNEFISYLNSMNNASGDNVNALAESQVTNEYYNSIRVDRKLGKFIVKNITNNKKECYIITGHAGDGKTSILVQVLKELELLKEGERLEITDVKEKNNIGLLYVKDMSEISEDKQKELLLKSLDAPSSGRSSLLISNTGPLIKSFVNIFGNSESKKDEIEDIILKQLDSNKCEEIEIEGYKFFLINIARIENLSFVKEIISNICNESLWGKCEECGNSEKCPVYFNWKCVNGNKDRVIDFVETYYRWLQENDKRITIRQILAQVSYAFTGNLNCSNIEKFDNKKYNKFNYNFANLFFGYRGIKDIEDSNQIKAIALIKEIGLDNCALNEDYEIFVKENFNYFTDEIKDIVQAMWRMFTREVYMKNNSLAESKVKNQQQAMRMAVRRFFLVYGLSDDTNRINDLYDQLYGEMFTVYKQATTEGLTKRQLKNIARKIYEALYIKNIGVPPNGDSNLYLTLNRNDGAFQSVLLLLGKASEKDLAVKQIKKNIEIEDTDSNYNLELIIGDKEKYPLNLPLLMHFSSVINGEISTEVNPSLSHGLAKLNTLLLKVFRDEKNIDEEVTMSVIVNTTRGADEIEITFEKEKIYIGG